MYYNGIDCYYFSGVKNIFRKVLNDKEIDDKEVVFVLKMKDFPFKTISNGKRGVGVYNKNIINSYFKDSESVNEIKRIIEKYRNDDIADLVAQIQTRRNYKPDSYDTSYDELWKKAKENNKEKMIAYLNSIQDSNPEKDMDAVSKQLLIDDDVMYESKKEDLSDVDTDWKPKEGLFLSKSPRGIANYLLKHSKDKGQAMKRLTFYMNRAGDNLTNKTVLNKVKDLLKTDESLHEWNCAYGFYIKEIPFNISLNESYADLPKIEKNQKIPNELYLEKYPNLRLSRMLGNEYLIGDNWKKYPYKRSYYFEIKMNIDNPKFKYNDIFGLLRISDHKVNPYKFANEFGNVYVVNGKKFRRGVPLKIKDENGKVKKYAFGIAITLPFTKDLTVPQDDAKYEPHVFEYISTDFADEDIDNLKDLLDNIVKKMETATVGIKDKFSPYEYKEVTIKGVNTVFDISNDDKYIYNRNKTANIKLAREATSDNQTIRRTGIKRLNPVERNLDYYINKLNMEPTVITVNKRKKQANQTVNYNGNIYRAIELQNLLRPYNFKSKSVIGFKDGLYVWKDEDENILAAAIVENRELKKIDL